MRELVKLYWIPLSVVLVLFGIIVVQYEATKAVEAQNANLRSQLVAPRVPQTHSSDEALEHLRHAPDEVIRLRKIVERLRQETNSRPERVSTAGLYPRENITFSGFEDPVNAYISSLSELLQGNLTGYLDSFTPEAYEAETKVLEYKAKVNTNSVFQIALDWAKELRGLSSIRILGTNVVAPDLVALQVQVYAASNRASRSFSVTIKREGSTWKLTEGPLSFK